jgi:mannose-6-phosphate isomerase-like protein (cupin superfamily)
MKSGKIWGETNLVFSNNTVQINQIHIKKGGRCSIHMHNHKNNIFFIQSGRLLIEQWMKEGVVDSTVLNKEDKMEIPSQIYHRFTALEDTSALEIYYLDIDDNDIIRKDCGSIVPIEDMNF